MRPAQGRSHFFQEPIPSSLRLITLKAVEMEEPCLENSRRF